MNTFDLQIVTPDGVFYNGKAQKVIVRAVTGDLCILSGHADLVSPVGKGDIRMVTENGDIKTAFCEGGLLSVKNGAAKIVSDSFEWKV